MLCASKRNIKNIKAQEKVTQYINISKVILGITELRNKNYKENVSKFYKKYCTVIFISLWVCDDDAEMLSNKVYSIFVF